MSDDSLLSAASPDGMQLPLIVFTIAIGAVVLTSGIWIPLLFWVRRRRMERWFAALATELGVAPRRDRLEVDLRGVRVTVQLHAAGKSSPWALEVSLPGSTKAPDDSRVLLSPERWIDRLGKRLGINREVQIGDRPFDRSVYIESDAPDAEVFELLGDIGRRQAVLQLFSLEFSRVELHAAGSVISATRQRPGRAHFTRDSVDRAAQALATIAAGVSQRPRSTTHDDHPGRAGAVVRAILVILAGFVAVFGGWVALSSAQRAYRPFDDEPYYITALVGLGLSLLAAPMMALVLRGKSSSFRSFITLVLVLVVALPGWTMSTALLANGALDNARPTLRPTRVVARYTTTGKTTTRWLEVDPLTRGAARTKLQVDVDVYDRFHEGDAVKVIEGHGAFGWRWMRGLERD